MHDRSTSGAGQLEGVRTIVRPEGAHPLGRTRVSKQLTYLKSSYEEFYNRKSRRELVQARRCRTGERVYFRVEEDDRVESLPRSWTDLARPDPFVEQAGGRAWFRIEELLDLVHPLESMRERVEEGGDDV